MAERRIAALSALALFASSSSLMAQNVAEGVELPQNPKPGECYALVYVPAAEKKVPKRVLVSEATSQLSVTQTRYEWVDREIEIEGPSERIEVIPAQYAMQKRTVVVTPAREEVISVPAEHETVTERVVVRQSYTTWEKGRGQVQRLDRVTGEVMRLVTVPAEYKTVKRRVVKTPARIDKKLIPAKTQTVEVRVMVQPPRTRVVQVPAKTKTIRVRQVVEPMRVSTTQIPAKYQTVMETVKADGGRLQWQAAPCKAQKVSKAQRSDSALIRDVQRALLRAGYNPGPVDGVLGKATMAAVERYQRAHNQATGDLSVQTLQSLGVDVN